MVTGTGTRTRTRKGGSGTRNEDGFEIGEEGRAKKEPRKPTNIIFENHLLILETHFLRSSSRKRNKKRTQRHQRFSRSEFQRKGKTSQHTLSLPVLYQPYNETRELPGKLATSGLYSSSRNTKLPGHQRRQTLSFWRENSVVLRSAELSNGSPQSPTWSLCSRLQTPVACTLAPRESPP